MTEDKKPEGKKLVCPVCGAKIDRLAPDAQDLFDRHVKSHERDSGE